MNDAHADYSKSAQREQDAEEVKVNALQDDPGPFPVKALSEVPRQLVEAVANVYQIPIELAAMPSLAVVGAAMGKAWKLAGAVNGRDNFGNLYIIWGAPKSAGKGAAAQLSDPICKASQQLVELWNAKEKPNLETKRQILEARAKFLTECLARRTRRQRKFSDEELGELETELSGANAQLQRIKPLLASTPSYHVGNATSEALAIKFARNDDTLFTIAYEAGDTLRIMLGKYSKGENADFDLWLSGYSVEPYQSDRVQRGNTNITPCLSALLFCQPSLLRELYGNEEAYDRGLTARVLAFICEPSLQEDDGTHRAVSEQLRDAWCVLIAKLLDVRKRQLTNGAPTIVQCDDVAREILRGFHNESIRLRNAEFHDIQGELGRWRENACQIALGLCVADNPDTLILTGAQAERAVKLARWAHYSGLQVMHGGRMERRRARVTRLQELVADYQGEVTLRILEKSHGFLPEEIERLALQFPTLLLVVTKNNPRVVLRVAY